MARWSHGAISHQSTPDQLLVNEPHSGRSTGLDDVTDTRPGAIPEWVCSAVDVLLLQQWLRRGLVLALVASRDVVWRQARRPGLLPQGLGSSPVGLLPSAADCSRLSPSVALCRAEPRATTSASMLHALGDPPIVVRGTCSDRRRWPMTLDDMGPGRVSTL
jgi:hypothetical protein